MTRRVLLVVRWGVFLAACGWLWLHLTGAESTQRAWGDLRAVAANMAPWFWPLALGLTSLNWGLEAMKWRGLVSGLERMPMSRALAATLAGTTMGLFTPNRTGDYVGRVLFLAPENRWQGGLATLLGSLAQLVATVLVGCTAIFWWQGAPWRGLAPWWQGTLLGVVAVAGSVALLFFLRPHLLGRLVRSVPLLRRMGASTDVLERYAGHELWLVLGLSLARYAVFWAQYVLFLAVLAGMDWRGALLVVPLIYLVVTLVPTMLLSEMGVRGSAAVVLLGPLGAAPGLVLLASFGVWAVNLALPALAGALILLVARIRTRP